MRRLVFAILVSSLLLTLALVQKGNIPAVKASSLIHQGDLILTGNNVTMIEGRFDINGSIIVEENATLQLQNAFLNFTQADAWQYYIALRNPSDGNPRLLVHNSTVTSDYMFVIRLNDNSTAKIHGSTIAHRLIPEDDSFASLSDSSLHRVYAYENSTVTMFNCTLNTLFISDDSNVNLLDSTVTSYADIIVDSVNCSIADLKSGFVGYWSFKENCTVEISPYGHAPNLTVKDTIVKGWWLDILYGSSNATISDSELYGLGADQFAFVSFFNSIISLKLRIYSSSKVHLSDTITEGLESYENSSIWLVNSTCNTYDINDQSKVYVGWYLDVHVVDSIDQNVPSANVTATYPNATAAESKLTYANGWTKLTLMEKMMNATGEYPVGNYTVQATYDIYSDETSVDMKENKQITSTLEDFIIPEFPSFFVLPLFTITTLLAVIVYRRKHSM